MTESMPPAIESYFFLDRHASLENRSCRQYTCLSPQNIKLLEAHLFRSSRPGSLVFTEASSLSTSPLELSLRSSFAFSGKVDIKERQTETLIGVATRSRKILDTDERPIARFEDPTSWKEHLAAGLVDSIGSLFFGDSNDSGISASRFLLTCEKRPIGSLTRETLPFFPTPPKRTEPTSFGKAMKRILPQNIGSALFDVTPPISWSLKLFEPFPHPDLRVLLAATVMTLEIRRWSA